MDILGVLTVPDVMGLAVVGTVLVLVNLFGQRGMHIRFGSLEAKVDEIGHQVNRRDPNEPTLHDKIDTLVEVLPIVAEVVPDTVKKLHPTRSQSIAKGRN